MLQRFFSLFFSVFVLTSCSFFQQKEKIEIVEIDTIIDYHTVDVFPLFPSCDSIPSQEKQNICSQIKLAEYIYASLKPKKIITAKPLNDTIFVKIKIDKLGKVSLSNLQSSDIVKQQIPNIDSLLTSGIRNLPQLKPAIKRGIPVSIEFTLPILVKN